MDKKGEQYDKIANKGEKEVIFKEGDLMWVGLAKNTVATTGDRRKLRPFSPMNPLHVSVLPVNNTRQCPMGPTVFRVKKEVAAAGNQRLEDSIEKLTSLVRQKAAGQYHNRLSVQECSMCSSVGHLTKVCPILYDTEPQ
ncbi:hypothetical protein CR513_28485, partial [Mucuna pruriens]